MTYELKLERLLDASPEVVFDAWVDADTQHDLFAEGGNDGWMLLASSIDLRVGGSWVTAVGKEGRDPDRIDRTLTRVDRPHRLAWTEKMYVHDLQRTIATTVTLTFEDQVGKTLFTMVQSGFEAEEDRDAFNSGWPTLLDTLAAVVAAKGR